MFIIKKYIKTILFFILTNVLTVVLHFWAEIVLSLVCGGLDGPANIKGIIMAFSFGILPLAGVSTILTICFSKIKNISKNLIYILNSLVIVYWVIRYLYYLL